MRAKGERNMGSLRGTGKTALITGASSGIGWEMSQLLAADGYSLIVCARRKAQLSRLADDLKARFGTVVRVVVWDLGAPNASEALWHELQRGAATPIDVLINNAGVGDSSPFAECDLAGCQRMMQLNVNAVTELTRCVLPSMLERRFGRILNLASVVAYQPGGPGMAVYYATKSYVLSWSKGLARELAGSGVRVTALCPGPTRTEFEQRAGAGEQRAFRWLPKLSARAVAAAGYRAINLGSSVAVPGWFNKLLAIAGELPPRRIALEINRFLLKR
jgi:short-subunit dehydrogenase